jgi:hypothetical protein
VELQLQDSCHQKPLTGILPAHSYSIHRSSTKWNKKKLKMRCTISTWRRTRAGLNGISTCFGALLSQSKIFSTSFPVTWKSSQFLIADSRRILIEYGSRSDRRNGQKHGSNHQYFQLYGEKIKHSDTSSSQTIRASQR